jgi:uncharacterized protein (DUF2235 family)
MGAYEFICRTHDDGDSIFLFSFSRGAYTVRALAGFLNVLGLVPVDQLNLTSFAFACFQKDSYLGKAVHTPVFSRMSEAKRISITFVGVWDTVAISSDPVR